MTNIVRIDTLGKFWCQLFEVWPVGAEVNEVVKRKHWSTMPSLGGSMRTDTNPIDLTCDAVRARLWPDTTNADYGVKTARSHHSHAIMTPETPIRVGIAVVCPLINQH